jgi:hypothetical protein
MMSGGRLEAPDAFMAQNIEEDNVAASAAQVQTEPTRAIWLTIAGLFIAATALGLALIPAMAMERPLPNPFAAPEAELPKEKPPEPAPAERDGGVTVKFKKLSVNFGGKVAQRDENKEEMPAAPELKLTRDPARWFTIGAMCCAIVGMVVGTFAQLREKHTVATCATVSLAVAALSWQYIAIGLAAGAALAVFLIVIGMLGSALNG